MTVQRNVALCSAPSVTSIALALSIAHLLLLSKVSTVQLTVVDLVVVVVVVLRCFFKLWTPTQHLFSFSSSHGRSVFFLLIAVSVGGACSVEKLGFNLASSNSRKII